VLEGTKIVHALDCAATAMGGNIVFFSCFQSIKNHAFKALTVTIVRTSSGLKKRVRLYIRRKGVMCVTCISKDISVFVPRNVLNILGAERVNLETEETNK
jgi:hypothetical protein